MALYHIWNVVGICRGGGIHCHGTARLLIKHTRHLADGIVKSWHNQRTHSIVLASSYIVFQDINTDRKRSSVRDDSNELTPTDSEDKVFNKNEVRMKFFDDIVEALPSSTETRDRIEEAKSMFSSSLNELAQKMQSESKSMTDTANRNSEILAESFNETLSEAKEALQNITQRLVKQPEPSKLPPAQKERTNIDNNGISNIDLGLSEEIINQTKHIPEISDSDTELLPRVKAAVERLREEIANDKSGDPPLALVSRKVKKQIEQFIHDKKALMKKKFSNKHTDEVSSVIDENITVVGSEQSERRCISSDKKIAVKKEESILEYIESNIPGYDKNDPVIKDIISNTSGTFYNDSFLVDDVVVEDEETLAANGWIRDINQPTLSIWRKPLEQNLSLYKIFGSFETISAVEFYNAQINDQYRSIWDKSVSSLYVIDNITNNREVVYWATKFPFPLKDRDYVFERAHLMDKNKITINSRSITHNHKPETSKHVRVRKYGSRMVIFPDKDFHQKGMRYVLTYYDDFGTPIPAQVRDRFANIKIPEFLEKVHDAAVYLGSTGKLYVPYPDRNFDQKGSL